jgi:hypothetical protein
MATKKRLCYRVAEVLEKERAAMLRRRLLMWLGAIVIVLAAFVVTTFILNYWDESSHLSRAKEQVTQIVGGFKAIYSNKPVDLGNWDTDITGLAINDHIMPADMLPQGASCTGTTSSDNCYGVGPWTGSIVKVYSGQQFNAIGIIYSKLDETACNQMAAAFVTPNSGLAIVNINVAGYGFPPFGNSSFPTSSDIAKACNQGGANQVQLLYGMK